MQSVDTDLDVDVLFNVSIFLFFFFYFLQWKRLSQRQASTMINFDALSNGLQRFSSLLSKTLKKNGRQPNSLLIGTYAPYRVNSEKCKLFYFSVHGINQLCFKAEPGTSLERRPRYNEHCWSLVGVEYMGQDLDVACSFDSRP